ncbi:PaaI family thioesterase [Alcanivorax quisquiliarum]|uniref:PaaI family thioesterase n=1 Tax=Alcanivorax quisquiliarum TaxID=2933565 RepID=A0ABT0E7K9_9GAMM|nr:PaaI family thioesterase [Alcanivorax quisquiliarum]MCK0537817.1 PaaI family thioesterase [Alcanivorax quisquiliarum]
MSEKTFGPFELLAAHKGDVPANFIAHRRIAAAMQQLAERLIRAEASQAELEQWAAALEQLAETVGQPERRDTRAANRRVFSGAATAADIFDMMDFDPAGGLSNPVSPPLRFIKETPEGVEAEVYLGLHYQGPPGRVHGGVIAMLLDAVLSRAMHASFKIGVTGTLNVRYLAGTPIETTVRFTARLREMDGRKMFIEGGVFAGEEQTVQAEGIFLQPRFGR